MHRGESWGGARRGSAGCRYIFGRKAPSRLVARAPGPLPTMGPRLWLRAALARWRAVLQIHRASRSEPRAAVAALLVTCRTAALRTGAALNEGQAVRAGSLRRRAACSAQAWACGRDSAGEHDSSGTLPPFLCRRMVIRRAGCAGRARPAETRERQRKLAESDAPGDVHQLPATSRQSCCGCPGHGLPAGSCCRGAALLASAAFVAEAEAGQALQSQTPQREIPATSTRARTATAVAISLFSAQQALHREPRASAQPSFVIPVPHGERFELQSKTPSLSVVRMQIPPPSEQTCGLPSCTRITCTRATIVKLELDHRGRSF